MDTGDLITGMEITEIMDTEVTDTVSLITDTVDMVDISHTILTTAFTEEHTTTQFTGSTPTVVPTTTTTPCTERTSLE